MKLTSQSYQNIKNSFQEALNNYINLDNFAITDIHIQPKQESGELIIYNDDDEELSRTVIEEWVDYSADDFYSKVEVILHNELENFDSIGYIEKLCIIKPFSFVMVDDDKETICEVFLVDDDTLLLNEELLKGLDEELDDFLKNLLEK